MRGMFLDMLMSILAGLLLVGQIHPMRPVGRFAAARLV